jgi:hypothetical protein
VIDNVTSHQQRCRVEKAFSRIVCPLEIARARRAPVIIFNDYRRSRIDEDGKRLDNNVYIKSSRFNSRVDALFRDND